MLDAFEQRYGQSTLWDKLEADSKRLGDDGFQVFYELLDLFSNGQATDTLTDPRVTAALDGIDAFFTGLADGLTAGGTTWLREQIWGDLPDSVRNHELFGVGQITGSLLLVFANPCAPGALAARLAVRAMNAAWVVRSGIDSYDSFAEGDIGWGIAHGVFALLGVHGTLGACFLPGTPVEVEHGAVAIETIRPGNRVWARSEHDPDGPLQLLVVEEVFERLGRVWEVTVNGQVIGTTGEHPFGVVGQTWVTVAELKVGDVLRTRDGQPAIVEAVRDTGNYAMVYNMRVAEAHTYFVGCAEWGFAVWVHNRYSGELPTKMPISPKPKLGQAGAAEWRYQRYGYQNRHRPANDLKDFDTWKRDHYDPGLKGGRPGREGGEVQVAAKDQLAKRGWQRTETTEHVGHFPDLVRDLPSGGKAFGEVGTMKRNGLPEGREWNKFFTQMMGMKKGDELHFFDKSNVDKFIKVTKGDDGVPILRFSTQLWNSIQ